ncbi:MAG TPA: phage Gp37/Gp68 family protein [Chitinivibrionales bacterium]|nr:phage Gp37/Gp68 family protein [Chitinivibrionales bacterium]
MSSNSRIEWTESTWNPITGCTKISPGCKNCYAERMARRLRAMRQPNYRNGFRVTIHPHALGLPLAWKKPQMVFVNSMSDLFHAQAPREFILEVFGVINRACWHVYQILTKRADRLSTLDSSLPWSENIWAGVTVENQEYMHRVENLRACRAKNKFISFEPLLGSVGPLNLDGIHWVIAGGESGPHARPVQKDWITEIRDQCITQGKPFFFKQWGGVRKKKNGRELDGRVWSEFPAQLTVA